MVESTCKKVLIYLSVLNVRASLSLPLISLYNIDMVIEGLMLMTNYLYIKTSFYLKLYKVKEQMQQS